MELMKNGNILNQRGDICISYTNVDNISKIYITTAAARIDTVFCVVGKCVHGVRNKEVYAYRKQQCLSCRAAHLDNGPRAEERRSPVKGFHWEEFSPQANPKTLNYETPHLHI